MSRIKKATRKRARLRLALTGPTGSGKTYSALAIATNLDKPVVLIDTEHGSSNHYAEEFDFSVLELESFEPQAYIDALEEAWAEGFPIVIIDSLSHAWAGSGGLLEKLDRLKARSKNKISPWAEITPEQNRLIQAVLNYPGHVLVTMRSKTAWDLNTEDRKPKKLGLAPVQREGVDYEFDIILEMDCAVAKVGKTRCAALHERHFDRPGRKLAEELKAWMGDGGETPSPALPEGHFAHGDKHIISPDTKLTADEPFGLGEHSGMLLKELDPAVLDKVYADQIQGKDPKAKWGEGSRELAFLRCLAKVRATRQKKSAAPAPVEEEETPAPRSLADRAAVGDSDEAPGTRAEQSKRALARAKEQAYEERRGRGLRSAAQKRSRSQPAKKQPEPGEAERLRGQLYSYLREGADHESEWLGTYRELCIKAEVAHRDIDQQPVKELRRLHQAAGLSAAAEGVGV